MKAGKLDLLNGTLERANEVLREILEVGWNRGFEFQAHPYVIYLAWA
ncbi:hypothetical protein [Pilibacter termitis]|nr:hypothetical protein [Pilibacter termitis]